MSHTAKDVLIVLAPESAARVANALLAEADLDAPSDLHGLREAAP